MKKLIKKEGSFESFSIIVRVIALFALTGLIFILGDKNITGGAVTEVFGTSSNYVIGGLAVLVVGAFTYLAFKK